MSNYARFIDGIAIDVSTDPKAEFHRQIADEFVKVPVRVARGWRRGEDGKWLAPEALPVPTEASAEEA